MMFQRRCGMIIKPIWRSNSYRSLSSTSISRRAFLQQRLYTQSSSTKICSYMCTLCLYTIIIITTTPPVLDIDIYHPHKSITDNIVNHLQIISPAVESNTHLPVILTNALFPYHSPCFLFFVNEPFDEHDTP